MMSDKFFNNVLTISVNCGIILSRAVNKTLSVLSTVIPQLVVAAIFCTNVCCID